MPMMYQSTRDQENKVTASQAILQGLAADGGLFTPVSFPKLALSFNKLKDESYQSIAKLVLSAFFDDFTEDEIEYCISSAYDNKFDTSLIAPVVSLTDSHHLELFHGTTIAFKDMALSILPYLLTTAAKKQSVEQKIVILTATSGDTGKAAMAGFADVPGTEIIVFYPHAGVSKIQELQMTTQVGGNTQVVAIEGNFDDAQTDVKRMFNDPVLAQKLAARGMQLSSANSMNIGRLIPQVVYYIYAYAQLVKAGRIEAGQNINITVPTGNFGNILAAYYAKKIGLPVAKFICASNENKVLTDFFTSGIYDKKRSFKVTTSPSMDILVSSNLERLVFHLVGDNAEKTKCLMGALTRNGSYELKDSDETIFSQFVAGFATEAETAAEIKRVFELDDYVMDPHTAVASAVYQSYRHETRDDTPTLIASTASPYKFPSVVVEAITGEPVADDFEAVSQLKQLSHVVQPKAVIGLQNATVRHRLLVKTADMQTAVEDYLGL
ncbi:threonine synthase [Streptococcus dysgalactiae]|uniref:threonine synthase n=1 Tax=Streptococcus dysgalactiae TaxID=1334 RepID=UPI0001F8614C|nr:threonine synthase [Streptococcus dysgalactiae]EFY01763.1 threonine synthase [Streptococcus dysgalactiae subsp. dysgalactiae ATCC 27957]MCB2832027.1 threonine synthase [Streptococcus dysgalactiae subsp. dysgalactiae]MCB2835781.1 threonine synthase [Streptococcus dysgalactiae subsp. dysgalactiae]MCB2837902.1 threonine synthase [Streptococcus dysgalactiae subsp. dysgalactiae]MCB2839777.1 threonine synthase [Streptococcus dysgalactiae subsp. dysgalactiae]